jgi:hypothetical protein
MPTKPPIGYMSVIPNGLLSMLQIKNDAKYPQALSDELLPVLDLVDWYCQTNAEFVSQSTTPGAANNVVVTLASLTVPASELWFVNSYIAQITAGAGGTVVDGRAIVFRQTAALNEAMEAGPAVNCAATLTDFSSLSPRYGVILRPGDSLGGFLKQVTVAAATFVGKAWITRMTKV